MTNTKSTAKSCSCSQCKHGKSGNIMLTLDERAYRHNAKIQLKKGAEDVLIAPKGNYYD